MRENHRIDHFAAIETTPPFKIEAARIVSEIKKRISNHQSATTLTTHTSFSFLSFLLAMSLIVEVRLSFLSDIDKTSAVIDDFIQGPGCVFRHLSRPFLYVFGKVRNLTAGSGS